MSLTKINAKTILVGLILLLFFPYIFFSFSRDASAYAYMGTLFFDGKIPYLDGFDHKGISLYLINAFGYLIGFKNYVGIRVLELALILYSFLQLFKVLKTKYSEFIALIATVFGLLTLRYFYDGGNLTESYGVIFVLISLSLVLKRTKKTLDWILIGTFFLINFTIRANLISFWVALFLVLTSLVLLKKSTVKEYIGQLSKMAIGTLCFVVFLAIYFLITSSFSEFYNAAFTYNFSYAKQTVFQVIGSIIKSTRRYEVSLVLILMLLLSVISIVKKRFSFEVLLLFFWIPVELYFSNMSGKLFAHYFIMWVPLVVLSTAIILDYFKVESLITEKRFTIIGITMFLFFQIPVFNALGTYMKLLKGKKSKNEQIANYINNNYKVDNLLVWGNESTVYNLTDKRAPVKNFYQTLFKLKSPLTSKMIADFSNKIQENHPAIIIDVKTPSLLHLDKTNIEKVSKHQEKELASFFKFVQENYQLKETKFGADFYIKK